MIYNPFIIQLTMQARCCEMHQFLKSNISKYLQSLHYIWCIYFEYLIDVDVHHDYFLIYIIISLKHIVLMYFVVVSYFPKEMWQKRRCFNQIFYFVLLFKIIMKKKWRVFLMKRNRYWVSMRIRLLHHLFQIMYLSSFACLSFTWFIQFI